MAEKIPVSHDAGTRITLVGLVVNILLAGLKFAVGILTGSQALVADAVHSLSDLFTDFVVLFGLAAGRRKADVRHHFGHARVETMASAVVSLTLAGVAVFIGLDAAKTILSGVAAAPGWTAALAAAVSIGSKEILYRYTVAAGRKIQSKAVVANAWHHRSDALSSVAVLIGILAAQIREDWAVADSWAAVVVALLILRVGISMFCDALAEFMDRAPEPEVVHRIARCVRETPGVLGLHDLKVRTSADRYQKQVHIMVDGNITVNEGHRIAREVEACLFRNFRELVEITVHMDPKDRDRPSKE
ncbi:MAG: cation diffusion facilitator family transporter [Proteobacteria bacterium]|nr:cation diffusion facilitator family transporter [Pseudomonadota bacterium]